MLPSLSGPRRAFALGLVAVAVATGAGIAAYVALGGDPAPPGGPDGPPPVVLVHGYGGQSSQMSTLATRLRATGRTVVLVDLPDRGRGDIDASVEALGDRVPDGSVDLVGYSLGGVVVRAWAAENDDRAGHVVTLGSPHHGARLADAAALFDPGLCRGACAQLRPGSGFLRELNDGDETPGDAAWTSVWTSLDTTVEPPESAVLDGAVNVRLQDVCPDSRVGHGSINRDPLPVGLVVLALDDRLPDRPGPDLCATARTAGRP